MGKKKKTLRYSLLTPHLSHHIKIALPRRPADTHTHTHTHTHLIKTLLCPGVAATPFPFLATSPSLVMTPPLPGVFTPLLTGVFTPPLPGLLIPPLPGVFRGVSADPFPAIFPPFPAIFSLFPPLCVAKRGANAQPVRPDPPPPRH